MPIAVLLLVGIAVVLALVGGMVPGVAHAVQAGRLPAVLAPERYLGPPYAGSVSGRAALLGALWWSGVVLVGVVLRLFRLARGTIVVTIALVLTGVVNVVLPLAQPYVGWSILGALQTAAIAAIAAAVWVLVQRDLPVVRARAPLPGADSRVRTSLTTDRAERVAGPLQIGQRTHATAVR